MKFLFNIYVPFVILISIALMFLICCLVGIYIEGLGLPLFYFWVNKLTTNYTSKIRRPTFPLIEFWLNLFNFWLYYSYYFSRLFEFSIYYFNRFRCINFASGCNKLLKPGSWSIIQKNFGVLFYSLNLCVLPPFFLEICQFVLWIQGYKQPQIWQEINLTIRIQFTCHYWCSEIQLQYHITVQYLTWRRLADQGSPHPSGHNPLFHPRVILIKFKMLQ